MSLINKRKNKNLQKSLKKILKRKNIYSSDNYNYEQKIVKTHFYKVNEFEKKTNMSTEVLIQVVITINLVLYRLK